MSSRRIRNLVVVLGDQLNTNSVAFSGFEPRFDLVWMAEVKEESTHVWSHKARTALFLSAMRHFRDDLKKQNYPIVYRELEDPENTGSLGSELLASIKDFKPERLVVVEPGDFRVRASLSETAAASGIALDSIADDHFLWNSRIP